MTVAGLMSEDQYALYHHSLYFKIACYEKTGTTFQSFFEQIMQMYDPSFLPVKPSGSQGDWKCDGFSQSGGTVYQCYAPEEMTDAKASAKVRADFDGAKAKWGSGMRSWVFVWSADNALPPQTVQVLQDIRNDNPSVDIDTWGRESLWEVVRQLSEENRILLLGPIPAVYAVTETTVAEVQTLLNFLARKGIQVTDDDLSLTDLTDKIQRNGLTEQVRWMIQQGLPVAKLVERYAQSHPDDEFSYVVAGALAREYRRLTSSGRVHPDVVFGSLVAYAANGNTSNPRTYWAAVGIVTHYFQLCEVFER